MTEKLQQQGDNLGLVAITALLNLFATENTYQVEHLENGKQKITATPVITLHSGEKSRDDMRKID